MPRHPTSFENYRRFVEYRNRIRNYQPGPDEDLVNLQFQDGVDLDAFGFRPALPGPYNYTPAEFSSHYLHVDLPPGSTSFVDDLTVPRNLLNIPEEFGAFEAPEVGAVTGVEAGAAVEAGPLGAVAFSAGSFVAYSTKHHEFPGEVLLSSFQPGGVLGNGALKAGQAIFQQFASPKQVQPAPPQAGVAPKVNDGWGNTLNYKGS
jgi:hypothetical protein